MDRLKNNTTTLLCIVLLLSVSACNNSIVGTYESVRNSDSYIKLEADGTFSIREKSLDGTGKYTVNGSNVNLTLDSGKSISCKLEGQTLTLHDDFRNYHEAWVKKPSKLNPWTIVLD